MDVRERFDIVLAMEVVEHVADVGVFLNRCAAMLKPGGMMVVSTLNRNWKSFALAIVGAEYVLRWLPRGTHQWNKFVTPDELARHLADNKLAITEAGRRGLQPARRQMEHLVRHGRELHGGGGGDVACHLAPLAGEVGSRSDPGEGTVQRSHRGRAPHPNLRRDDGARTSAILSCADQVDRAACARHGAASFRRYPPCSPSPRSGFPSPSLLRSARSRAMRCSGR